jgi:tRNA(fMet)-specific endonuclease VapC
VVAVALDTNVVVELVRGKRMSMREQFEDALARGERLVTSLVVLHELRYGCELHHDPPGELRRVQAVLQDVEVEPLDETDIVVAAKLRSNLTRIGRLIGAYDVLIAGQALARDWTLVTANTREFSRIEGLKVIDWSAA